MAVPQLAEVPDPPPAVTMEQQQPSQQQATLQLHEQQQHPPTLQPTQQQQHPQAAAEEQQEQQHHADQPTEQFLREYPLNSAELQCNEARDQSAYFQRQQVPTLRQAVLSAQNISLQRQQMERARQTQSNQMTYWQRQSVHICMIFKNFYEFLCFILYPGTFMSLFITIHKAICSASTRMLHAGASLKNLANCKTIVFLIWMGLLAVHQFTGDCLFDTLSTNIWGTKETSSWSGPPGLVVGVMSSRDHFMQRVAVRNTWAPVLAQHQHQLPIRLVFVLGDHNCPLAPKLRTDQLHCLPKDIRSDVYAEEWTSNHIASTDDWEPSKNKQCIVGLGLRANTDVFGTKFTMHKFHDMVDPPTVWLKSAAVAPGEIKLETGNHVFYVHDVQYFLPAKVEVEIVVEHKVGGCMVPKNLTNCKWQTGSGSVEYTSVRLSDGSVRPWNPHYCPPFSIHFENGMEKCPENWKQFKGLCYYFSLFHDMHTFKDAKTACEEMEGSFLASVQSDEENNFIYEHKKVSDGRGVWLGLWSQKGRSVFEWVNGDSLRYTNWDSYEPNNFGGNEQCVEMQMYSAQWNDDNCLTRRPYVCQKSRMNKSEEWRRAKAGIQDRRNLQLSWQSSMQSINDRIQQENVNGDLLIVPGLTDTYDNLPYKLKALIQWSNSAYPNYWLMKTDDDSLVNVDQVMGMLSKVYQTLDYQQQGEERCEHGSPAVYSHHNKLRAVPRFGKWADHDYSALSYPDYPAGAGYILSGSVVSGLADVAPSLRCYQGEDVSLGVWLASLTFNCERRPDRPTTGDAVENFLSSTLSCVLAVANEVLTTIYDIIVIAPAHSFRKGILQSHSDDLKFPDDLITSPSVAAAVAAAAASLSDAPEKDEVPNLYSSTVRSIQQHLASKRGSVRSTVGRMSARMVSVPCWLRSSQCNESYSVAADLSVDEMDAMHRSLAESK